MASNAAARIAVLEFEQLIFGIPLSLVHGSSPDVVISLLFLEVVGSPLRRRAIYAPSVDLCVHQLIHIGTGLTIKLRSQVAIRMIGVILRKVLFPSEGMGGKCRANESLHRD